MRASESPLERYLSKRFLFFAFLIDGPKALKKLEVSAIFNFSEMLQNIFSLKWANSDFHLSFFQIVRAWRDFTVVTKLIKKMVRVYMVLGDAVSKLETFVWIFNHISRSITWSLFTLKVSYSVKWPISTWSFRWWCQFIDWLKFETRPSSLLKFGILIGSICLMRLSCCSFVLLLSPQVCLSRPYLSAAGTPVSRYVSSYWFLLAVWREVISILFLLFVLCNIIRVFFCFKAAIHMNRSKIWSNIKREFFRIKMGWKHYQTVDTSPLPPPPPYSPKKERAPGW